MSSRSNLRCSKSSSYRDKEFKSESVSSRSKYSKHKNRQIESKTPPLPTTTSTLEELIKERESLKYELEKMVKKSNGSSKNNKKRKHATDHYSSDSKLKKGRNEQCKINNANPREHSPEIDNAHSESEDEETIIQKRREQRKQLLENFTSVLENNHEKEVKIQKKTSEDISIKNNENPKSSKEITDMFSEIDQFASKETDIVTQDTSDTNLNLTDNWDDSVGYYNVRVGDVILNKYTVKGLLGKGVFASVVRAQDNSDGNDYVAIKIVRNNDLMYKTSLKEIEILKEIGKADPENNYHCVQMLGNFMHRGHLCILLESLHMDLRAVIKKYGKHHGINLNAVVTYSRQLLLALKLLKKLGIIHADIKPDNILVNEKKNVLKLCDFGSASKIGENEPTPYLVSRFYRAPEIILGITYKHSVDIWSAACTIYEMATTKIMFTGGSNNKMIKCFMDLKGKFSSKYLKRGKFKDQHFNYNNNFLLHKKDEFTNREKVVEISNVTPSRDLFKELKKCYKNISAEDNKKVGMLKDLLEKMTTLDSSLRYSATDCLKHSFILDNANTQSA